MMHVFQYAGIFCSSTDQIITFLSLVGMLVYWNTCIYLCQLLKVPNLKTFFVFHKSTDILYNWILKS